MQSSSPRKTAIVTGGASGIGVATCLRLAIAGYNVLVVDQDEKALAAMRDTLPSGRFALQAADVSLPGTPSALVSALPSSWGPVAVLVNNAGIAPKNANRAAGLEETGDELWERVMAVNLTSAFRLCREIAPLMKVARYGRIVNMSSLGGRTKSLIAGPSYMASKAGMLGLTRSIAVNYAPFGITANCVAPGRIDTPMALTSGAQANREFAKAIPVLRFGTPEEVASVVEFLAAETSGFITGAVVDINGGFFMS